MKDYIVKWTKHRFHKPQWLRFEVVRAEGPSQAAEMAAEMAAGEEHTALGHTYEDGTVWCG